MDNLKTIDLLARRYWKSLLYQDCKFSFTEQEQTAFNNEIIRYFQLCHEFIRVDLELKSTFSPTDLLTYLHNTEETHNDERRSRVLVAYGEIFDEEFHHFAELLEIMEPDLTTCIEEVQSWLLLRIWNSQYNHYDPKTDVIINKFLTDDGEFRDSLISICYRGVNNPAFCRWIIAHWTDCSCYQYKMRPLLEALPRLLPEQHELLTKIKALE